MTPRKALFTHQRGNVRANLVWGPPLAPDLAAQVGPACAGLRALGYCASPFPEGDGVSLGHDQYTPQVALADVRARFPWLAVTDVGLTEGDLYEGVALHCTVLVPVERFHLTRVVDAAPYRLIPPLGADETGAPHPWGDYFGPVGERALAAARKEARRRGTLGITRPEHLLAYPLVETAVEIPVREITGAAQSADGQIPLLRRCAEAGDRGLDLVRLQECTFSRHERLCGMAGQLLDGFHAAYVIPPGPRFTPKLYCHLASPFQVAPNWLGLDLDRDLDDDTRALAPVVHATAGSDVALRVRGGLRAAGQAFYVLTPEARFLSLVFAADGLCAPKRAWSGFPHHAYVAAVAAAGDGPRFGAWLRSLNRAYSEVRNPIVHRGASFIELGVDPADAADALVDLLRACAEAIIRRGATTVADLRARVLAELRSAPMQEELRRVVAEVNSTHAADQHVAMPSW